MKNKIFMYWDNVPPQTKPPAYIQLCWKAIHKHCGNDFDIHLITTENVKQFLPKIPKSFFEISQINNKSNFLRYMLLKEHGGIWLDSDLVLFDSLISILHLFDKHPDCDLIATASPGYIHGEPEAGFIASKPEGEIITQAVKLSNKMLKEHPPGKKFPWSSMGPSLLRKAAKGKKYIHLASCYLQPIHWMDAKIFAQPKNLDNYINHKTLGVMLYNQGFKNCKSQILNMTEEEILNCKLLIGDIFRRALNI